MVRPNDKWTKGDVIHYIWIGGALPSVIIFLNTTHVLITKNSDFCEVDENVDDFLKRNNVLFGLPDSIITDNNGNVTKEDRKKSTTDELKTKNETLVKSGISLKIPVKIPVERRNDKEKISSRNISTSSTTTSVTTTLITTTSTTTTSSTTKINFMDKLTMGNGRWRQVKTVGLEQFLKAEGGNWIYRSLAASAIPDFIYTKIDENHYQQRVEVSVFPSQLNELHFGIEYTYIDQFGDKVTCFGVDNGDHIESVTTGGRGGKMRTFMQLVNNQLFLTTILEDKNDIKAVRIFEKQ